MISGIKEFERRVSGPTEQNASTRCYVCRMMGVVCTAIIVCMLLSSEVFAQWKMPPPEKSDPVILGMMEGFPPSPDKTVTREKLLRFPAQRWAFRHMREFLPTANVRRGNDGVKPLPYVLKDLDSIVFETEKKQKISISDWQKMTYTDALLVLRDGKIVYERYQIGMKTHEPHMLFSMTKSFTGLLASILIEEGKLDPDALVSKYVPELKETAWGDATVQQTLDMTAGVKYREDYSDYNSEVAQHMIAAGMIVMPSNYNGPTTIYEFLKTLKKEGEHGAGFQYKTCHADVIGWVLSRVTGKSLAELLSQRIWTKIGAEEDAFYVVDAVATPAAGSTFNATLRDIGRFGEVIRLGGVAKGKRIFSQTVVDEIRKGADREKFKASGMTLRYGYSYHNQWWIAHDRDGTFEGKGVHGQHIHINPAAKLVIVKLSSHPIGSTTYTHNLDRQAFAALAGALRERN